MSLGEVIGEEVVCGCVCVCMCKHRLGLAVSMESMESMVDDDNDTTSVVDDRSMTERTRRFCVVLVLEPVDLWQIFATKW